MTSKISKRYAVLSAGAIFFVTLSILASGYLFRSREQEIVVGGTAYLEVQIVENWAEMESVVKRLQFPKDWGFSVLVGIELGPDKTYYAYFVGTKSACKLEVPIRFGYSGNTASYRASIRRSELYCPPAQTFASGIGDFSYNKSFKADGLNGAA